MPKLFVQTICFLLNTCFPPGSLEFWQVRGRGCLHDQLPEITLGCGLYKSFPGWQHLSRVVTTCCGGN